MSTKEMVQGGIGIVFITICNVIATIGLEWAFCDQTKLDLMMLRVGKMLVTFSWLMVFLATVGLIMEIAGKIKARKENKA